MGVPAKIKPLKDSMRLLNIIAMFHRQENWELQNAINDYGKGDFFRDLWQYFHARTWQYEQNKYITFTNIVLMYYSQDDKKLLPSELRRAPL